LIPLPREICGSEVQRYGFHGLSYEYVASLLPQVAPEIAGGRVIVALRGSGASLCALKDGKMVGDVERHHTLPVSERECASAQKIRKSRQPSAARDRGYTATQLN